MPRGGNRGISPLRDGRTAGDPSSCRAAGAAGHAARRCHRQQLARSARSSSGRPRSITVARPCWCHAVVLPVSAGRSRRIRRVYVADTLEGPCLLYDLPGFTTGLDADTSISLMQSETERHRDQGQQRPRREPSPLRRGARQSRLEPPRRRRPQWSRVRGSGLGRRDFRHRRVLSRAAGRAARRRPQRADGAGARVPGPDRRAHHAPGSAADAMGRARRAARPRPRRRSAAAAHFARRAAQIARMEAWLPGWLAAVEIPNLLPVRTGPPPSLDITSAWMWRLTR